MLTITRWAGKHPLLVRVVLLPILFYMQGHLAFTAGAHLYFDGVSLPTYWVWSMLAIIWVATYVYPANARAILHVAYWRVKGVELVACSAAFGLWLYVGNQMAQRFEGVPVSTHAAMTVVEASLVTSENITVETETKSDSKLKKAYRSYFKNAVKRIKRTHRNQQLPLALGIVLGVLGIGLGIIVLVCSIQCGSTGGAVALGVISGVALIGLGVWALIAGLRRSGGPRR